MAIGDDHWTYDCTDPRYQALARSSAEGQYHFLAREARDSGYPLDIGTFKKLNKKGEALLSIDLISDYARYEMDEDSPDASWRTFRDCNPSKCLSIFTSTSAVPLKCHWLDIESCKASDIVDQTTEEEKKCDC